MVLSLAVALTVPFLVRSNGDALPADLLRLLSANLSMSVFILLQWGLRVENVFGARFARRFDPNRTWRDPGLRNYEPTINPDESGRP